MAQIKPNSTFTNGKGIATTDVATTSANGLMSSADKTNVDANTAARHSHSNKTVLDSTDVSFTSTLKASYDVAATNSHTHSNKAAIDAVSGTNTGNETTTSVGALVNGATAKTTPVDADMVPLMDSAASNIIKKLSWANIKATLKTYFDTLYNNYSHPTGFTNQPGTALSGANVISQITVNTEGHVSGVSSRALTAANIGAEPTISTKNTAFNVNFETTATNIKMDGTQSVGTASTVARADHVHPTDTSRASTAVATTEASGLMSNTDKTKLDGMDNTIRNATITTTWVGASAPFTQDITVDGITSSAVPVISPIYNATLATALLEKEAWNLISKIETGAGKITVTCFEEKPKTAINIQIKGK